MKYQKIINLLDNTPTQSTNIRTKNWVKIDDDSRRGYNTNSKIKFQTSMFSQVYVIIVIQVYL